MQLKGKVTSARIFAIIMFAIIIGFMLWQWLWILDSHQEKNKIDAEYVAYKRRIKVNFDLANQRLNELEYKIKNFDKNDKDIDSKLVEIHDKVMQSTNEFSAKFEKFKQKASARDELLKPEEMSIIRAFYYLLLSEMKYYQTGDLQSIRQLLVHTKDALVALNNDVFIDEIAKIDSMIIKSEANDLSKGKIWAMIDDMLDKSFDLPLRTLVEEQAQVKLDEPKAENENSSLTDKIKSSLEDVKKLVKVRKKEPSEELSFSVKEQKIANLNLLLEQLRYSVITSQGEIFSNIRSKVEQELVVTFNCEDKRVIYLLDKIYIMANYQAEAEIGFFNSLETKLLTMMDNQKVM